MLLLPYIRFHQIQYKMYINKKINKWNSDYLVVYGFFFLLNMEKNVNKFSLFWYRKGIYNLTETQHFMKCSKVDMMIVFIGCLFIYYSSEGIHLVGDSFTECLLKIKFEMKTFINKLLSKKNTTRLSSALKTVVFSISINKNRKKKITKFMFIASLYYISFNIYIYFLSWIQQSGREHA